MKLNQKEPVTSYFEAGSSSYAGRYERRDAEAHSFRIRAQRIKELLADCHSGRLLDLGCGPGLMAEHFLSRGFEFFGVDISEGMIAECRSRFGDNDRAHFIVSDAEKLDFADGEFDAVVCMGLFEYLDDESAVLREIHRVLKPGGVLLASFLNKRSPYRIWHRFLYVPLVPLVRKLMGRSAGKGVRHRAGTFQEYSALVGRHGFAVEDVVYYNFLLFPSPLDKLLPRISSFVASRLEVLGRSFLGSIGTAFILRAVHNTDAGAAEIRASCLR
jgi:ubiquinone/menaquinone biosynthesis C-methylase UbiE